jgi:hypothetical protein
MSLRTIGSGAIAQRIHPQHRNPKRCEHGLTRELSGWVRSAVTHRPDQAASHQGRAVGAASAWRNRRFESVPSSGESAAHTDQAAAGREPWLSRGCALLGWRRPRWSEGRRPRRTRTDATRAGHSAGKACHRCRSAYGRPRGQPSSAEERLALVQPGIVVQGQVRVCDSQWARMLILCARAESTGSAKQAADAGPFTWAGRSRSASKTSR